MPHRQRYLFVCTNRRDDANPRGSCAQRGSEALLRALEGEVAKRGAAGAVRVCAASCLDLCEIGAAIVQEPEHVAYGNVTLDDVAEVTGALLDGGVAARLVVRR